MGAHKNYTRVSRLSRGVAKKNSILSLSRYMKLKEAFLTEK
jgi:hypothetical protein